MKVTFVYSQIASHWLSCQTITRNLLLSYSQFVKLDDRKKCQTINFNKDSTFFEVEKMAHDMALFDPDIIIFLDHTPHPFPLLSTYHRLIEKAGKSKLPKLVFHVYGDFPLMSDLWMKSSSVLKKFLIKWVCASDAQVDLIKKFISSSKDSILKIPFPVDQSVFHYNLALREKVRKKLGIRKDEVVFVYSGRISFQKRIQDLLGLFDKMTETSSSPIKLLIAGPFDSLGNPYIGDYFYEGEFVQKLIMYFNSLRPKFKSSVRYLGCLEERALNEIYNAADIFVSLSTHNDEDFGMSPAEALSTGLPALLTNWGGYSSFKKETNYVELIPTKININKPLIDINMKRLSEKYNLFIDSVDHLREERLKMAKLNQDFLSVNATSSQLAAMLKKGFVKFNGFTSKVDAFNRSLKKQTPFLENNPKYSQFYNDLYESYISKEL